MSVDGFPAPQPDRPSLPVVGQGGTERADAARNRQKVLAAAASILASKGATALSLDEVARVAGVGVGTVYRRFGDRSGLISALVDEREREFQTAFMTGPPPMGPGARPAERLRAFLHACVDRIEQQRELLVLAETSRPTGRYDTWPYQLYHLHVVALLNELVPGADVDYLADSLLAPLTPTLIHYQRQHRGFSVERITHGLDQLLNWAMAAAPASADGHRHREAP